MENQNSIKKKVELLHATAKKLIKSNLSENQVIQNLLGYGIDTNYAHIILENVKLDIEERKEFIKLIAKGAFLIIAGFAINYFSYKIAEHSNSIFFYLFWGIIITGVLLIIRAFILFTK